MGDRFKRVFWNFLVIQARIVGGLFALVGALFLLMGVVGLLAPGRTGLSENARVSALIGTFFALAGIGLVVARANRLEDVERWMRGPKDWRE